MIKTDEYWEMQSMKANPLISKNWKPESGANAILSITLFADLEKNILKVFDKENKNVQEAIKLIRESFAELSSGF